MIASTRLKGAHLALALACVAAFAACSADEDNSNAGGTAADSTASADTTAADTTVGADAAADDDVASAGPTCEAYCAAVTDACVGADAQYADLAACTTYCKDSAKLPAGAAGEKSGNSIACRTEHAALAVSKGAATHCPHAGPSGGNVCGSWCDNYCHLAATNCAGGDALFADAAACQTACATAANDGEAGAMAGDTLQCRISHLGLAAAGPATHCPHGKIDAAAGSPCGPAAGPKTHEVATSVGEFVFKAADLTIAVGDTVKFILTNNHNAVEVAEATWDANGAAALAGGFTVAFGATKEVVFDAAGTHWFVCEPHASMGMKGKITVK